MRPSDDFVVPAVDISPYVTGGSPSERARIADAIDSACATVGFIQVLGHGVPDAVTESLAAAMDSFFELPLDAKKNYLVPDANRGYSPPKSESLSLSAGVEAASKMNDFFEAYNVGVEARSFPHLDLSEADYGLNLWPDVEGFAESVRRYFDHAARVARTLTGIFADALDVGPDYFTRLTDHSIDVLRMNNYALPEGTVTLDGFVLLAASARRKFPVGTPLASLPGPATGNFGGFAFASLGFAAVAGRALDTPA